MPSPLRGSVMSAGCAGLGGLGSAQADPRGCAPPCGRPKRWRVLLNEVPLLILTLPNKKGPLKGPFIVW